MARASADFGCRAACTGDPGGGGSALDSGLVPRRESWRRRTQVGGAPVSGIILAVVTFEVGTKPTESCGGEMGVEEQVGDTVKLALQKYWTFFGIAGVALIVFAAGDGFPKWLVQLSAGWQEATFLTGCVFVAACFLVVAVELRGGSETTKELLADFGVEIASPDDNEMVKFPIRFVGTFKRALPKGYELWLFGCASQLPPSYWPQRKARITATSWTCDLDRPWTNDKAAIYAMVVVGPDGQALVRLYWELNLKAQENGGRWAGTLNQLTADMVACTDPRVFRWQEAPRLEAPSG